MTKLDNTASAAPAVTDAKEQALARLSEQLAGAHPNHKTMFVYVEDLRTVLSASSATEAQAVERPARVQAAFEVWREHPETGPNASALFEYIETLEAALSAAPAEAQAVADLRYLLEIVEAHADKFPAPEYITALVQRIRARSLSAIKESR